jgi:tRNA pseudouridine38-40 synthase
VASFCCESRLPAKAIAPLLNRRLPADARVRAAADAPPEFHARHSARSRRYAYRVLEQDDVLMERFAWRVRGVHDWERVDAATRALERRADFRAFAAAGSPSSSTVCRVRIARWRRLGGGLRFDIVADRFLYHMVRNIVGTALRVAPATDPAAAMLEVLESGERARAGATAPAHGLCLERVGYDDPEGA